MSYLGYGFLGCISSIKGYDWRGININDYSEIFRYGDKGFKPESDTAFAKIALVSGHWEEH